MTAEHLEKFMGTLIMFANHTQNLLNRAKEVGLIGKVISLPKVRPISFIFRVKVKSANHAWWKKSWENKLVVRF